MLAVPLYTNKQKLTLPRPGGRKNRPAPQHRLDQPDRRRTAVPQAKAPRSQRLHNLPRRQRRGLPQTRSALRYGENPCEAVLVSDDGSSRSRLTSGLPPRRDRVLSVAQTSGVFAPSPPDKN